MTAADRNFLKAMKPPCVDAYIVCFGKPPAIEISSGIYRSRLSYFRAFVITADPHSAIRF